MITIDNYILKLYTPVNGWFEQAYLSLVWLSPCSLSSFDIHVTASGLVGLVQPMLWDYTPNLDVDKTGRNHIQLKLEFKNWAYLNKQIHCNMCRTLLVVIYILLLCVQCLCWRSTAVLVCQICGLLAPLKVPPVFTPVCPAHRDMWIIICSGWRWLPLYLLV